MNKIRGNSSSLNISPSNEVSRPIQSDRIPSLDGLRGIAIVLVLLQHAAHTMPDFLSPLLFFAGNGGLGVSIFFLLSGYLIYSLSVREYQKTGGFNWKQFYIRRALRIFPCFYFYILVILALAHFGWITVTDRTIFAAATFTLNYHHLWDPWPVGLDYPVIGHYWTLALEGQFYLTWPLLMLLNGETGWVVNAFPINLMCAIAMGLFSYYMIENPFLKLKDYFHKPRQSKPIKAGKELAAATSP